MSITQSVQTLSGNAAIVVRNGSRIFESFSSPVAFECGNIRIRTQQEFSADVENMRRMHCLDGFQVVSERELHLAIFGG